MQFDDVMRLEQYISQNLLKRGDFYGFRGHANAEWTLSTTLARFALAIKEGHTQRTESLDHIIDTAYLQLYERFRRNVIVNNDLPEEKLPTMDLSQFGQHYGLPSPLLDWTWSPYVALFFALSEETLAAKENVRCIWVIDTYILNILNIQIETTVKEKLMEGGNEIFLTNYYQKMPIINEVSQHNRRLSYQQGFFTKLRNTASVEAWINRIAKILSHSASETPFLQKLSFNSKEDERLKMLDKLNAMNINSRTLFPDIFGSIRDAKEYTYRSFLNPRHKEISFYSPSNQETQDTDEM